MGAFVNLALNYILMDAILRLAKKYSKKKHTDILPCCDVNILEKSVFLYTVLYVIRIHITIRKFFCIA